MHGRQFTRKTTWDRKFRAISIFRINVFINTKRSYPDTIQDHQQNHFLMLRNIYEFYESKIQRPDKKTIKRFIRH